MTTTPAARTLKARQLHADGLGYKAIAHELGVTRDHARQMGRPDRRKRLERARAARQRRDRGSTAGWRRHQATRAIVVLLWHDGASLKEIAERIGWTPGSLGHTMVRWRREGLDLPYRPSYPRPSRRASR